MKKQAWTNIYSKYQQNRGSRPTGLDNQTFKIRVNTAPAPPTAHDIPLLQRLTLKRGDSRLFTIASPLMKKTNRAAAAPPPAKMVKSTAVAGTASIYPTSSTSSPKNLPSACVHQASP